MGLTALLALHASAWLRLLAEVSVKAAVVLALAMMATLAMRRSSAAWRHLVWSVGVGGALCLPLLSVALPALRLAPAPRPHPTRPTSARVETPARQAESGPRTAPVATTGATGAAAPAREVATAATEPPSPPPPPVRTPRSAREKPVPLGSRGLPQLALLVWAMGAFAVLLPMLIGMRETRRLLRGSAPAADASWGELLEQGCAQLSLRRPVRLMRAGAETIPMAWGWWRPVVLLPASAEGWSLARKRIVLRHELAHVKRGDWGSQMLGYVTAALYWFNPLAWLALHRLQREREQACDDLVLHGGFKASDYAEELMGLVRGLDRPRLAAMAAVPMARAAGLERRLRALLETGRNRNGVTLRAALMAIAVVAVLLVPLSSLRAFPAAGGSSGAQRELGAGPAGATLYMWDPDQTWFGDARYDPRLDRPVQFWRAGLSLAEVFAGIEEQTGARIGFWPEGDDNPRVRVNLYLNPKRPPALRAVLAQLMWATDCALAYTQEEGGCTYYLLGTSLGGGLSGGLAVLETRAAERAPKPAPQARATHGGSRDDPAAIKGRLDDLRQALSLSREEAIARYRGVDDYLLLALVDPGRRAAVEYACGVIGKEFALPGTSEWSTRKWSDLSEAQRDLVWRALRFDQPGERDLISNTEVEVTVDAGPDHVWIYASANIGTGHALLGRPVRFAMTPERGLEELDRLYPDEIISFAENLGETVPEDTEQDYVAKWKSELSAKRRGGELRLAAENAGLSRENQERLAAAAVPLKQGGSYALWEVQETVAAASGLNVISDCFWQPRRPLYQTDSWVNALASASESWGKRARTSYEPVWLAGWEWGDAGSFLRFRSLDRDVWRASFLPAKTVTEMEAYLAPFLPKDPDNGWPQDGFSLRLKPDTFALLKMAVRLNDFQLAYGGRLPYEDPSDPRGACRQALREALLGVVTQNHSDADNTARAISAFRFIASLTPEQWESARGHGLTCKQMTEEQLARLPKCLSKLEWVRYHDELSLLLLKAGDFLADDPDRRGEILWFYVTLVQPKETFQWLPEVPVEHRRDMNLFEWVCYRHVDVNVPAPQRPVASTEKAAPE